MQPSDKAIRKRTQIANTNRMMFIWVAGVSVVLGISIVAAVFLVQMLMFNEKVIAEKNNTVATLEHNNQVVDELQKEVRKLDVNQALIDAKSKPEDRAIQVILDALPSDANSLALGASLQNKLLAGIDGITLNQLQVDPVAGVESLNSDVIVDATGADDAQYQITFQFVVIGNTESLKKVLTNLEKSIRTIDITLLKLENSDQEVSMTVQGRGFYEPVREVNLKDKTVR